MNNIVKSDFLIDEKLLNAGGLTSWKKEYERFNIYFFTAVHNSVEELMNSYSKIRDYIAVYFQGDYLTKDVERWNIYQFHLLKCFVDPNLKQLVEQDKFSTRKIVLDQLSCTLDEESICRLIDVEIFQFSVQRREIQNKPVLDVIREQDEELAAYLTGEVPAKDQLIQSLIDTFGNG